MKTPCFLIMVFVGSFAWANDKAIDRLVAKLTTDQLWLNGLSAKIESPEKAPLESLVAQALQVSSADRHKMRILESKPVRIEGRLPNDYTAVLVDTKFGQKIVLLQYDKVHGWWNRVFDPK